MQNTSSPKFHNELLASEESVGQESNPDLKEKIMDLKESLDDSSDKNRNFLMTFLLIQIYLLVTVGGTTDMQLLMPESNLDLPIVNFAAPLFGFYILAPVFLIALHFNVLFNLLEHSRKLFLWVRYNGTKLDSMFLPAFMFNSLSGFKIGEVSYYLLRAIIFFIIYFFPLGLLTLIQWRFSDYHNLPITLWHFAMVIVDLLLLSVYWDRIITPELHESKYEKWTTLWRHNVRLSGNLSGVWKILNLTPSLTPITLCFYFGVCKDSKPTLIGSIVFFIIFICVALLNRQKINERTFADNQKNLFLSVYLLAPLWRKESRSLGGRANQFGFKNLLRGLLFQQNPVNVFTLLVIFAIIFNVGISFFIKSGDLKWHGDLTAKYSKRKEIINFFIPRIEVSEERIFGLLPDRDLILKKNQDQEADRKGAISKKDKSRELGWLDAYSGVNLQDRDLRLADFSGAVLYKIDFRGGDLQGADFSEAELPRASLDKSLLRGANFSKADLRKANLSGASLDYAKMRKANLKDASLDSATLNGANLERATLNGASLYSATLNGANLERATLKDANLKRATLNGANLSHTTLKGANLERATLNGAELERATLSGADLERATLKGANLERATLNAVNLEHAILNGANFESAKLNDANLSYTKLNGANLSYTTSNGANLEHAKLNAANLYSAKLSGAKLDHAKLNGANLSYATLNGASLYSATLNGASLYSAKLNGASLSSATLNGASLYSAELNGAYAEQTALYGADMGAASFDDSFGIIDDGSTEMSDFKEDYDILKKNRTSLDAILSETLKKALRPETVKIMERGIEEAKKVIEKGGQRLKEAEERLLNYSEAAKSELKKKKNIIEKTEKRNFLKSRVEQVCAEYNNEYFAIGVLRQYTYYDYSLEALFDSDKKQAVKAGGELLKYMEKQCPKTLEKMEKIPRADEIISFFK